MKSGKKNVRLFHVKPPFNVRLFHAKAPLNVRLFHAKAPLNVRLFHAKAPLNIRLFHAKAPFFITRSQNGGFDEQLQCVGLELIAVATECLISAFGASGASFKHSECREAHG